MVILSSVQIGCTGRFNNPHTVVGQFFRDMLRVVFVNMQGQCRFLVLIFLEASSVASCSFLTTVCRLTQIKTVIVNTYVTNKQIYSTLSGAVTPEVQLHSSPIHIILFPKCNILLQIHSSATFTPMSFITFLSIFNLHKCTRKRRFSKYF